MDNTSIIKTLSEGGHKLTRSRKEIAQWITQNTGLFSVSEIRKALTHLDKVSVYRTLELFSQLDVIHAVTTIHGEQHYELHGTENHHHHIVCMQCETNECIPCEVPSMQSTSFESIHHSIVFTGVCVPCTTT